ncbi:MAG: hypothetical protein KBC73_05455 [Burkholderiaceae bacterium]|nr:hypothetical protein [Burkholderiaceae bacterium]
MYVLEKVDATHERMRGDNEARCGAPWQLAVRVPVFNLAHLAWSGRALRWIEAPAVVDDFGDLVPVGPWQ